MNKPREPPPTYDDILYVEEEDAEREGFEYGDGSSDDGSSEGYPDAEEELLGDEDVGADDDDDDELLDSEEDSLTGAWDAAPARPREESLELSSTCTEAHNTTDMLEVTPGRRRSTILRSFTQSLMEETKQRQRQHDNFERARLRRAVYVLQRGSGVKKKLENDKNYKDRFLFLSHDLQSLSLAKSEQTRHQAKVFVPLKGGLQAVRGGPTLRHKKDAEQVNFHSTTFSLHLPKGKEGSFSNHGGYGSAEKIIDLWFPSETECEEWLKCLSLVAEALTRPDKGPRELVWSDKDGGGWVEGPRHYLDALAEDVAHASIVGYMDQVQKRLRRRTMRRSTNRASLGRGRNNINQAMKKMSMNQLLGTTADRTRRGGQHAAALLLRPRSLGELLSHHAQPIKRAFHLDLSEAAEGQAVKAFRLIMQYMGDLDLSGQEDEGEGGDGDRPSPRNIVRVGGSAEKLVGALRAHSSSNPPFGGGGVPALAPRPKTQGEEEAQQNALLAQLCGMGQGLEDLRKELYVAVVAQTTHNPDPRSLLRGWQLLVAFAHAFLPADEDLRDCLILHADRACHQYVQAVGMKENVSGLAYHAYDVFTGVEWEAQGKGQSLTLADLAHIQRKVVPASIFGCSLEEVLRKELVVARTGGGEEGGVVPDELPASGVLLEQGNVPLILQVLIRKFQELNGYEVEGIFRRAAHTDVVSTLKKKLEDGSYVVYGTEVLETADPMVVADLLKIWLRHLAEPLIPMKHYRQALDAGQATDLKLTLKLLKTLPAANAATLEYLVHFLNHCAELSKWNQMTLTNLSIVMTPNLLRHPSNDPMLMVQNTENERKFVGHLMRAIVSQASPQSPSVSLSAGAGVSAAGGMLVGRGPTTPQKRVV